jgi:arylsulfatase A-like enzyme
MRWRLRLIDTGLPGHAARGRPGWLAAAALLAGCAPGAPLDPQGGLDLLARRPDVVLEQPGELVPDRVLAWRPHGQFGWEQFPDEGWVWARRSRAFLELAAGPPRPRELALTLRGAQGGPRELRVALNGVALGTLELSEERAVRRLATPAPAWREGQNLLELSLAQAGNGGGGTRSFALARVVYDEPARVRFDGTRRVRLAAGTALGYGLEPLAASTLHLQGRALGAGELSLTFLRAPRERGEPWTEELAHSIPLRDQELARALPVPDVAGELLEFRIAWHGAGGSSFGLERLRLVESPPPRRFPIIVVSIDTLSALHLSLHGFPLETTPRLEQFARQAIVFERCLANAPWTLPSFMSLWTGLPPNAHRLRTEHEQADLWEKWYLASNRWTLAESLRAAGYPTAGFVDSLWISERFGLAQGFDHYDASAGENDKTDPDGGIRQVLSRARGFLTGRRPEEPVFLFLHAFDVHGPYSPPEDLRERFAASSHYDPERTAPAGGPSDASGVIASYIARGAVPEGPLPERMHTAPLARAYDEGILLVDQELGRFFDWLEERGILEHALVVVTADHGEQVAGDPYIFGHGVLDEEVLRVPLIVRLPGGRNGGRRVNEPVQLLDLYPTLLDLAGVRGSREHLVGRSLVPLLEGAPLAPAPILCEGGNMRQAALYAGDWKLVERDFREAPPAVLLSSWPLSREWCDALERELRARGAGDELFAWRRDRELAQLVFERLPDSGLTEALLAEIVARPGSSGLLAMLRQVTTGPRYELYDLAADPAASRDVRAEHTDKAAELLRFLRAAQARRDKARLNARPPTQPVELGPADIDQLEGLGYADGR